MSTYREWAQNALSTPWMRGKFGERLVSAIALIFDQLSDAALQAGAANLFDAPSFAPDALPRMGIERMLERYPSETDAQYKVRLKGAWLAWSRAGTSDAIITQLAGLGITAYTRENYQWNWDGDPDNWSRFWVVITGHPWTRRYWGDGSVWGDGSYWGMNASSVDPRAVQRVILKWKPAHMVCTFAIIVMELGGWLTLTESGVEPDGTWDDPLRRLNALYMSVHR